MKLIIKFFPEITIKSKSVRKQMVKQLFNNINYLLKKISSNNKVIKNWSFIEVNTHTDNLDINNKVINSLKNTPGIVHFLRVKEYNFSTLEDIAEITSSKISQKIIGKTFCVRIKRLGNHDFTSLEAERMVGGFIKKDSGSTVRLKNPDITIKLEIKDSKFFLVTNKYMGIGGYPIGTQEPVISLMSGGFDSGVSTYLSIKKGSRVHHVFFNLGGYAHEVAVKQVSYYLWNKYSSSQSVYFMSINFEEIMTEILRNIHHSYMGVILKRMMMRAGERAMFYLRARAIVTGESVAQVSSQTITNLSIIDRVTGALILRPLSGYDKPEIIALSDKIGTKSFAENVPEYCGVISDRPTTAAKIDKILEEEEKLDVDLLINNAISNSKKTKMKDVLDNIELGSNIKEVNTKYLKDNKKVIVLDIRPDSETNTKENKDINNKVIALPFFKIKSEIARLDKNKKYALYCSKGVLSQIHGIDLIDKGYNICIYRK